MKTKKPIAKKTSEFEKMLDKYGFQTLYHFPVPVGVNLMDVVADHFKAGTNEDLLFYEVLQKVFVISPKESVVLNDKFNLSKEQLLLHPKLYGFIEFNYNGIDTYYFEIDRYFEDSISNLIEENYEDFVKKDKEFGIKHRFHRQEAVIQLRKKIREMENELVSQLNSNFWFTTKLGQEFRKSLFVSHEQTQQERAAFKNKTKFNKKTKKEVVN